MDYAAFDDMIEGVQIVDRDFRYVYVNAAVAEHGKTTRPALVGKTMVESYPGIEHTEVFRLIRSCLDARTSHQMVNEFRFPDGSTGYFQLRIQPVPEGALVLSFDVTEQRRAEIAMRDWNALLEAQVRERTALLEARNDELEQIAYIASHDLQEPLRTLRSHVDVLVEDCGDRIEGDALEAIGFIRTAAERMQTLVGALLDYARLGHEHVREPTDLGELVAGVLRDLSSLVASSGAVIEVGALPTLPVYRAALALLFQNLVTNGIKFAKPGQPPSIRVEATRAADRWEIAVRDRGIGFDMAHKDKIFVLFQRLHGRAAYAGTGIGLAHCKKVVAMHGGEIRAESVVGEGSTFTFTLPIAASPGEIR